MFPPWDAYRSRRPKRKKLPRSKFASARLRSAGSQVFSAPGVYTFTVPPDVTQIVIESWGPGGDGPDAASLNISGTDFYEASGGGGGGAYAKTTLTVVPGATYTVTVTGHGSGASSSFGVVCTAGGGQSGSQAYLAGGTTVIFGRGGTGGSGTGDTAANGGNGYDGSNPSGGAGGSSPNGGTGGVGAFPFGFPSTAGGSPGGGGGGGGGSSSPYSNFAGAAGADGQVKVAWSGDSGGGTSPSAFPTLSKYNAETGAGQIGYAQLGRVFDPLVPSVAPIPVLSSLTTLFKRKRLPRSRVETPQLPPSQIQLVTGESIRHRFQRFTRLPRSIVRAPERTPDAPASVPNVSLFTRGQAFARRVFRRSRVLWEWLAGYDFSIALAPASAAAVPGAVLVYTVTIAPAASPSTVHLSVSGLPFGTLAVFGATSITGAGSTTLTLYLNEGALAQVASIAVTGTSGYFSHTTSTALTIEREQLGSIMILIDNLDRTDLLTYASGRIGWNLMRGNRGTCSLPFIIDPGSTFAPQIGQYVEIWDQAKRVWAGDADGVDIAWLGDDGHHVTTVSGVSLEARFDGVSLDKVQYGSTPTPITCGAAFSAIFAAAAVPGVTLGTIEAGPNLESLNVTNVKDAFDTLAKIAGKIWYIDPRDLKIYFHDAALRAADWELTDQASSALGGIVWESIAYRQNRTDFADTQVSQLPGAAIAPQSTSFAGDGATTLFTLPAAPQFILSADVSPEGSGATTPLGHTITWTPGTNQIACTPAMKTGESLIVKWLDSGQVSDATLAYGSVIGHRTRRYTRTRTFTAAGALQEATAALARYALLPAQLTLQTDKPGITIGRKWQVGISSPVEAAGLLNGYWQVIEVEAEIVEGMDQLAEPFGHWRYTLHLVNFSATAIFQGDGSTASFTVPGPAATIGSVTVKNAGGAYVPTILGNTATIAPAPPEGATVTIQYTNGINPDVQPFTDTLQQLAPVPGLPGEPGPSAGSSAGDGSVPSATSGLPQLFSRTLTLYDMTVRNDAAPNTYAVHAGVGKRVVAVLRKSITADATIRLNFFDGGPSTFLFTVPDTQPVDDPLVFPLVVGSPATALLIEDLEVFTADILESDGSGDDDGVLQVTVEWEYD